jgi:hypothetical protein
MATVFRTIMLHRQAAMAREAYARIAPLNEGIVLAGMRRIVPVNSRELRNRQRDGLASSAERRRRDCHFFYLKQLQMVRRTATTLR